MRLQDTGSETRPGKAWDFNRASAINYETLHSFCDLQPEPHFLTTCPDGSRRLAEIKYRADFRIITENEIRSEYLRNARFLSGYLADDPETGTEDHLAATLATLGETTGVVKAIKMSRSAINYETLQ